MIANHRVLTTCLLLSTIACAGAPERAEPSGDERAAAAAPPPWKSLTLITGDRVEVAEGEHGARKVRLVPGPGREHIGFVHTGSLGAPDGDLSVIPTDAVPLLAAGAIDRRLFAVGDLLREGYGARAGGLPLIVTYAAETDVAAALHALPTSGAGAARPLPSIHGAALRADPPLAAALWSELTGGGPAARRRAPARGIDRIWLDARAQLLLDQSASQIGAPQAHALGLTGEGVTVAVLDTGLRLDHPDLAGRIAESRDFTDTIASAADDVGHGTHVAGTVAGSGAASQGRYRGIAPGATLLNGKVCRVDGCPASAIIAGMEWAAPRARIVNMSLGGDSPGDCDDPIVQAVNNLTAQHGTLFVIAAGNAGSYARGIGTPACADAALAVASVTKRDELSEFSSWGPRAHDRAVKPDIAAPGSDIVAARAAGTLAGDLQPIDDHYARLSGTSMATPHVAGAAALLAQQHPDWRAAELKAALMTTAAPIAGATPFQQGDGRVDLVRATSQRVFATVPSVSVSAPWPHQDAIRKVVTYRNDGDAPVTLALAPSVTPVDGGSAPDRMITVSSPEVTVPAHGTAEVTITVEPRGADSGLYGGRLTAASGAVKVEVAVGVYVEPESYDLAIDVIPRDPHNPEAVVAAAVNLATREAEYLIFDGSRSTRLVRGRYDLLAVTVGQAPRYRTMLTQLGIELDQDRAAVLDARLGEPVRVTVDRPSAVLALSDVEFGSSGTMWGLWGGRIEQDPLYVVPTPPVTDRPFRFELRAMLEPPAGAVDEWYRYDLAFVDDHRIPDGPFVVHDAELAVHDVHYRDQGAIDAPVTRCNWVDDGVGDMACYLREQPMPVRGREYFTASRDILWEHQMYLGDPPASPDEAPRREVVTGPRPVAYTPGQRLPIDWNRAPVGPGLCPKTGAYQEGDDLDVALALFSPSELDHCTDSAGWSDGWVGGITGTTTLWRDGVIVATSEAPGMGKFPLPPQPATYTLVATADRAFPWSGLGTHVEAAWTFRAAAGLTEQPLPLLVVRASGEIDDHDVAPGGRDYPLTLHVQRETGTAPLTELALEVSYDDGATWQAAPVTRAGDTGTAVLAHPPGDHFVSLRSRAADADGNRVEQTVVRAYAIRGDAPPPTPAPDAGADGPDAPGGAGGCGCGVGTGGGRGAGAGVLALATLIGVRRRKHRLPHPGQPR